MKDIFRREVPRFLIAILLLCTGAGLISGLTKRSTGQVVLHSTNVTDLTNRINNYYSQGYRVILSTNQDVSNAYDGRQRGEHEVMYGEVMVVMER